jgi:NAD(P)H dehydrogenase (quinone)
MNSTSTNKVVMTGANGRLGRSVARMIAKRGDADTVTLATRDPDKITDLVDLGFKAVRADFADPESMRTAFDGATTALVISMPGPIEERIPLHRNAFDAARDAQVGRLVYTSRVNPTYESLYPFARIHAFSEEYLKSIGLQTTIVRNTEYIENVVKIIGGAEDQSELLLPGATGKVPYIAVADVAEILSILLLEDGHGGKIYELNGPEALSRSDIADIVGHATGRPTVTLPVTAEEFGEFTRKQGRPAFVVEMVKGLHAAIDAGEFANVWPDAAQLLGRQPQSPRAYLRKAFEKT